MDFIQKHIWGLWLIRPKLIFDERGYFMETYMKEEFERRVGTIDFVQESQSCSVCGVLRGMHYQQGEAAQAKLINVLEGTIQDVVVDLRKDSNSFGKYETVELSAENKLQFFIPRGFAHGFLVLSEWATINYKVDNVYCPDAERILYAGDKDVNILWDKRCELWKQSEKDRLGSSLREIEVQL
ncbi:MAG: dTDP-4-dehydrorhamnose 3,5-epimerase [Candidatus Azobacteroides pseudotrichonymphae]|jgi:dTDP-4-dehydrorhamnose 3,5-epimerase|uniref:dTDP-4-dehydrorhamnose 3,5-epimerase n=1 Tax=Azobacteroides pseudotrichonymphae genomovar. CFP2 TaxID=511995 RepID=B6YRA1_AZOPC|nr:dTDP-4-dehydrorhamnose 3,5-epimerase [Candidatus Azobacteroides pseudotrichonymphae]MDR0530278.1 dTDP-4-dehydrorhamnose 3,5-epimerase [Bacteroidales bacterium OttesenSCG-928-I14]BAG83723.1 dTDP-4-dehydrorhamnose 3,5-epimerase [Candidatus Azobacteroides pseudotrichonymphae genomovar. CFP2]GMO34873.1 MAG: dTDP-4-dehydrorhamnose 3,5-epimerase [Candidatus Azobacteroides pseudotrichonymphae]